MKNLVQALKVSFLCCFYSFIISCSNNVDTQQKKTEEIASFLKFYQKDILKKDSIILLNNTFDYEYPNCLDRFRKDEKYNDFSEKDIAKSVTFVWDKNVSLNAKLIQETEIPDYSTPEAWRNFRKRYGEGYFVMSKPIISNDLKSVIFYTAYYCGDRCGYTKLALYQKTSSGWKLIKKYCDGVN